MRNLTLNEEKRILETLVENSNYCHGGGRLVFEMNDEIGQLLGLDRRCVVKVAMGQGGLKQLHNEVDCFLSCDDTYLARIYAVGKYVEIMEYVEVEDWCSEHDDFADADEYLEYHGNEDTPQDEINRIHRIFAAMDFLDNYFGYTPDNGQLGVTVDGRIVAYDYGFIPADGCDSQTSTLGDYIYDELVEKYIFGLIDILDKEESFLADFERDLLAEEGIMIV